MNKYYDNDKPWHVLVMYNIILQMTTPPPNANNDYKSEHFMWHK